MNLEKLDLRKELVINLKKELNITNQKAEVVLALDYSGSMEHLFYNGTVQELLERLLPIALQFDDNGNIDFYGFKTGCREFEGITLKSIAGLAQDTWINYGGGGTDYAPVINQIVRDKKKSSLFGGSKPLDLPIYVIFITDGETSNRGDVTKAVMEASKYGIFFQFVGIGHETFSFLQQLDTMSGRNIDNANFFKVPDLNKVSDQDLYKLLLTEFPSFITEAKSKNLIK